MKQMEFVKLLRWGVGELGELVSLRIWNGTSVAGIQGGRNRVICDFEKVEECW